MQKNRPNKPVRGHGAGRPAQQVRIIGGQWKRTPLSVLDAEGLRPTPDRVRETVFNWLTHLLDGNWSSIRCLDLFAGTGALGFEAASRGAASVTMVEDNPAAVRQLEATKAKLNAGHVTVRRGNALTIAGSLASTASAVEARFDVVFLDPPYRQGWLEKTLPLCARLLADGGLVYAESEMPLDAEPLPEWLAGWHVIRADKAGMVFYHLLQRNDAA
ncbi:MAG TPA: 16S rRNA (guanine(966)-N(2))-methyltransferase RsmD [Noviherbaspirillum sp.]